MSKLRASAEAYATIYSSMGHALHEWQGIEHNCLLVFERILQCKDPGCAYIIFNAQHSFTNKLNMIDLLVDHRIQNKQLLLQWRGVKSKGDGLYTTIQQDLRKRDKLAHWSMVTIQRSAQTDLDLVLIKKFFDPKDQPSSLFEVPNQPMITKSDIDQFSNDFRSTANRLFNFHSELLFYAPLQ